MKYLLPLVSGNLNSIFAVNISIKKSIAIATCNKLKIILRIPSNGNINANQTKVKDCNYLHGKD
jgi:hypothetical protein